MAPKKYKTEAEIIVEKAKKQNRQTPLTATQPSLFPEEAVDRAEEVLNQVNDLQGNLMKPAQSYSKVVREQVKRVKDSNTLVAGRKGRKPTPAVPFSQEEKNNIIKRVQNILDNELVVYIDTEFSDYSGKAHTIETAMKNIGVDNPADAAVQALVGSKKSTWNKDFVQIAGLIHDKGQEIGQFDEWGNISNDVVNKNAEMVTHETLGKINPQMLSQFPAQGEMLANVSKKLPQQPFYAIGSNVETADILPIMKEMIFNGVQTPTIKGSINTATLAKALGVAGKNKKDPSKPSYGLQEVSESLGHIPENAHNALDDNKTVRTVLERLLMSPSALVDLLEGKHTDLSSAGDPNQAHLAILEQGIKNAVNRGGVSSNPQSPYYNAPAPSLIPDENPPVVDLGSPVVLREKGAPGSRVNNLIKGIVDKFKKIEADFSNRYNNAGSHEDRKDVLHKWIDELFTLSNYADEVMARTEISSNRKLRLQCINIKLNIGKRRGFLVALSQALYAPTGRKPLPQQIENRFKPITGVGGGEAQSEPVISDAPLGGINNNRPNTIHPLLGGNGANMPPAPVNTQTDNENYTEPPEFNDHSNDQPNLPPDGGANRDTAIAKWKSIQAEEKTLREAIRIVRKMTDTVSQSDTAKILLQKVNTLIAEAHTVIATIKQGDNQHG
jgi:hypothetical protein